jgi:hypothetical protein
MSDAGLVPSSLERFGVTTRSCAHHRVALRLQFDIVADGTTLQATTSSDARKEEQR